jgi:hypothetical protein
MNSLVKKFGSWIETGRIIELSLMVLRFKYSIAVLWMKIDILLMEEAITQEMIVS